MSSIYLVNWKYAFLSGHGVCTSLRKCWAKTISSYDGANCIEAWGRTSGFSKGTPLLLLIYKLAFHNDAWYPAILANLIRRRVRWTSWFHLVSTNTFWAYFRHKKLFMRLRAFVPTDGTFGLKLLRQCSHINRTSSSPSKGKAHWYRDKFVWTVDLRVMRWERTSKFYRRRFRCQLQRLGCMGGCWVMFKALLALRLSHYVGFKSHVALVPKTPQHSHVQNFHWLKTWTYPSKF